MARKRISKSMLSFVLITVLLISGVSVAQKALDYNTVAYSGTGEISNEDKNISAKKMIKNYADENGYCVDGGGSLWALMSEGAQKLGIDSTELPLDKQRVINNLEVGNPVVCIMGPGDFTKKRAFHCNDGYRKRQD